MLSRKFLITIIFLIHIFFSLYYYQPYTFLHEDGIAFAFISVSLAEDGDLYLENNFPFIPIGDRPEKSFYSIGRNGKYLPKHSPLMPFLAIPFYKIFKFNGFLIFNLLIFLGILFFLSRLLDRKVTILQGLSFSSVFFLPFIFYHTYSFCPDIFLTFLISGSFLLISKKKELLGGILTGLSVFVRPNYIFQIFPSFFISKRKGLYLFGTIIGIIPFILYNTIFFGLPWITSYDKTVVLTKAGNISVSHYELFSVDFSRFWKILALYPRGLFFCAPIVFPLLIILFFKRKVFKEIFIFLFTTWIWHYLFYSFYVSWLANHYGLRFFIVPVLLTSLSSISIIKEKN